MQPPGLAGAISALLPVKPGVAGTGQGVACDDPLPGDLPARQRAPFPLASLLRDGKSWQGRSREKEVTFLSGCFVCCLGMGWKKDFAGSIKEAIV